MVSYFAVFAIFKLIDYFYISLWTLQHYPKLDDSQTVALRFSVLNLLAIVIWALYLDRLTIWPLWLSLFKIKINCNGADKICKINLTFDNYHATDNPTFSSIGPLNGLTKTRTNTNNMGPLCCLSIYLPPGGKTLQDFDSLFILWTTWLWLVVYFRFCCLF